MKINKLVLQFLMGLGLIILPALGLLIEPDATAFVLLAPLGIWMAVKAYQGDQVIY